VQHIVTELPQLPEYKRALFNWARTRYVTFAPPNAPLAGGDKFLDIPGIGAQHLPPIRPIQLPDGVRTPSQSVVMPAKPPSRPGEDWYWRFMFWVLEGGENHSPSSLSNDVWSPTAEMTPGGVVTNAVFELGGGPIEGDTPAWNIRAWDRDDLAPLFGPFFNIPADPTLNTRANAQGLVDTYGASQVIEARNYTNPFGVIYTFSEWTTSTLTPISSSNVISAPENTAESAIAWYHRSGTPRFPGDDRELPAEWWKRWILRPPTPDPRVGVVSETMAYATILKELAERVSPELRSALIDLSRRQADIASTVRQRPEKRND